MARENLPQYIQQYWTENPTQYTLDDMFHLEPDSENTAYLKFMVENFVLTPKPPTTGNYTIKSMDGTLIWEAV